MRVVPCGGALGARIEGLDLSKPLDDATVEAIKQAWREHLVIIFPQQDITLTQQIEFSKNFGWIMEHPQTAGMPAPKEGIRAEFHRGLLAVTEAANTSFWHTDITGMAIPPTFSILYGKDPIGRDDVNEDTSFCNMYRAYEELSPGLKDFLGKSRVINSMQQYRGGRTDLMAIKKGQMQDDPERAKKRINFGNQDSSAGDPTEAELFKIPVEQLHPCVRQHPETNRLSLYIDGTGSSKRIEGWSREESKPFLQMFVDFATREDNVYHHKWTKGDLVCWDNRCTMHRGPDTKLFPKGAKRFMVRTTVIPHEEQRPFGPPGAPKGEPNEEPLASRL